MNGTMKNYIIVGHFCLEGILEGPREVIGWPNIFGKLRIDTRPS